MWSLTYVLRVFFHEVASPGSPASPGHEGDALGEATGAEPLQLLALRRTQPRVTGGRTIPSQKNNVGITVMNEPRHKRKCHGTNSVLWASNEQLFPSPWIRPKPHLQGAGGKNRPTLPGLWLRHG